ncbi:hypothetical protein CDL15_Pgr015359 [Punica granatum]|uniref:WD repeat-containing protein 11-like n=1 Tax=Punica granatum TaxID=22663 RepID=A0A218VZD5_PUNGR|nr:hypothetical protein CDL15_Pgr015359 [Punica granatum]
MSSHPRPPDPGSWDAMLPGPPSRNNFGSLDLSSSGLLAFASGSSVSVVDSRSLQHISTLPLPPPPNGSSSSASSPSSSLSPFVTAVRWAPNPLPHSLVDDLPSPLLLAAGDRHGRLLLLDFRSRTVLLSFDSDSTSAPRSGIQDLCWIRSRPTDSSTSPSPSLLLAAISGPSLLSLYSASSGSCLWRYDSSPEYLSCLRCDPFDSRHFCAITLRGFLLSIRALGDSEDEISITETQIRTDSAELTRLERDSSNSSTSSSSSPASAVFPTYMVRLAFSTQWKHIMFVTFPRELVVFDLQYETALYSAALPRGCGKFLDVLPDPNHDLLYCAHLDGRLSIWKRKEGEQVHVMCTMEELMPSIGTYVPSPSVLAVVLCESDSTLQNIAQRYSDVPPSPYSDVDIDNPFDFGDDSLLISKTRLISISDDGKVWNWLLTSEGAWDAQNDRKNEELDTIEAATPVNKNDSVESSIDGVEPESVEQSESVHSSKIRLSNSSIVQYDISYKCMTNKILTEGGGNSPAVAVPLVALGTQSGTIDVVDVSANAVATSFSVHNGVVRGLRWLGNSRLVSFSYTQVNEKTGGYINRLVVTCLRSGVNRTFRVLQKPERAPIRALRASSSGRYLLILFRDAPVEVWAMTKTPIMLRSLALPFTVLEWTLPTVPRPSQSPRPSPLSSIDRASVATDGTSSPTTPSSSDSKAAGHDGSQDETSESFAFALVNGALGVFEVHGRRIRDFRPKWPSSSFVSSDGLITAMAYRLPHVVMGDRSGNVRWWDVTTGHSSSFNTHREGIRRIKFSPVVEGDRSRGRVAVLFYDNTFSVYDLDSLDPLANSLLQPQFPGTLVLELDWLSVRMDKNDPLVLCIAGADSSFRLIEVNINDKRSGPLPQTRAVKERFRPMPLCSPILLPLPHALALRMILQLGVKPSWFNTTGTTIEKRPHYIPGTASSAGDLRGYMVEIPPLGDSVVPEMLLKVLEPYRREGCILDEERARLYATVVNKGCAVRFAFAASVFGESPEALFWLQLPRALNHLMSKFVKKTPQRDTASASVSEIDETAILSRITSKGKSTSGSTNRDPLTQGQMRSMAFEQHELWENANERVPWHEKLEGEEAIQNRVHELISVGNLEAAVSLLLTTPPESSYFYVNALRAVALSSAVSQSLHELAVKVVAANMVRTDRSLSGTHLLCAVGRYQEACSQLQDAGCWTDAATLAATHLKGTDYSRVLQRWADHILQAEHNIWRALILYVAAGALQEALAAIRAAQQPDTAAMFILACREIHEMFISNMRNSRDDESSAERERFSLPGLDLENEDVGAVGEYFGQYQRKLVHLCMDSQPIFD